MVFNIDIKREANMDSDIFVAKDIVSSKMFLKLIPDDLKVYPSFIITDDNVSSIYAYELLKILKEEGCNINLISVPASESSKSIECFSRISDEIIRLGVEKKSYIISLGGGVVNNLAGFVASTLYRGIRLIHFPTTSLAQVDATIDFKQAVNSPMGKNLIGSFYPADIIIVDPYFLTSLSQRHLINGLSESIKHALVQDKVFLNFIRDHTNLIISRDPEVWERVVTQSVKLKAEIMDEHDEFSYQEMIKQYGHAVGHAIEHMYINKVYHGEAISIGMCLTAYHAYKRGFCAREVYEEHRCIFRGFGLPTKFPKGICLKELSIILMRDKSVVDGKVVVSFPAASGQLYFQGDKCCFEISLNEMIDVISEYISLDD